MSNSQRPKKKILSQADVMERAARRMGLALVIIIVIAENALWGLSSLGVSVSCLSGVLIGYAINFDGFATWCKLCQKYYFRHFDLPQVDA